VHLDELDQLRPVVLGEPIGRLDLAAALDVLEKCLLILGNLDGCQRCSFRTIVRLGV
jgi:hypothetical protein